MPDPTPLLAPALALLAYALPEGSAEAWAAKTAVLAAGLTLFAGWRVAGRNAPARVPGASLPWLLLGGWFVCTAVWSLHPARSVFQAAACGAIALLAATGTGASVVMLTAVVLAAATWETMLTVVGPTPPSLGSVRAVGSFVNADHFAAYLAMAAGLVLPRVATRARPGLMFWLAVFVALSWAGGASASRASVAAALAIAVGAWWLAPRGFSPAAWSLAVVAGGAGMFAAPALTTRVLDLAGGREAMAWARLDLWTTGASILRSAPLTGTGLGTFGEAFTAARPERLAAWSSEYAHSEPVQTACETGLIGLGLAAWTAVVVARRSAQLRRSDPAAAGLFLAALAVGAFALVDFPLHAPAVALTAVLALVTAIGPREPRAVALPRLATGAVGVVAAGSALWLVSAGAAEWCYAGGVRLALGGDVPGARGEFIAALRAAPEHGAALCALAELEPGDTNAPARAARAERLRPGWAAAVRASFDQALRAADPTRAAAALDRAGQLDPHGLDTRLMRIRWAEEAGDLAAAARELATAERLWPVNLDLWYARAELAERKGNLREARARLRHILRIYPNAAHAHAWLGNLTR